MIDLILIIIILVAVYYIISNKKQSQKTSIKPENFKEHFGKNYNSAPTINKKEQVKKKPLIKKSFQKSLKPYFLEMKFHTDYRDVLTAMYNLVPNQRQLFNVENTPLSYGVVPTGEVTALINDFIQNLNENIRTEVTDYRTSSSGWDELEPDPNIKSGWTKAQEALGLHGSLYKEPAKRGIVKLLTILKSEKYETDDEIRYITRIVIYKKDIPEQMLIKVSFMMPRKFPHSVIIEELDMLGIYTDYGEFADSYHDTQLYNFDGLEETDMLDDRHIVEELLAKYKKRTEELNYRNSLLDKDSQQFHKELPSLDNYDAYKVTKSITDDMKCSYF